MNLITVLIISMICYSQTQFSGPEWENQTADAKFSKIWPNFHLNTSVQEFFSDGLPPGFFTESMNVSFDLISDQLPPGRVKEIHSVGIVGQVEWAPTTGHNYTGIFADYSKNAILRLSLTHGANTSNPDYWTPDGGLNNFAPGVSLKIFRDHMFSANMVGIRSVNGQDSWNFFKNPIANHFPRPIGSDYIPFEKQFATGDQRLQFVGSKEWGQFDTRGNEIENRRYPFELAFVPSKELNEAFSDSFDPENDWANQVMSIKPGQLIYQVYALESPESDFILIANINAKTEFTYSYFGDRVYFVRHNRVEYDLTDYPQWAPYLPIFQINETDSYERILEEEIKGCPFLI